MEEAKKNEANAYQHDGDHYKKQKIQHWDYVIANDIPYMEAQIIRYVSRWKNKAGLTDLLKARHFIEKLIEVEMAKPRIHRATGDAAVGAAVNDFVGKTDYTDEQKEKVVKRSFLSKSDLGDISERLVPRGAMDNARPASSVGDVVNRRFGKKKPETDPHHKHMEQAQKRREEAVAGFREMVEQLDDESINFLHDGFVLWPLL